MTGRGAAGMKGEPAVTFDDVAVCFSEEEWRGLRAQQKNLYREVMTDNYLNLTSLGLTISPPEIVVKMECGEDLCVEAAGARTLNGGAAGSCENLDGIPGGSPAGGIITRRSLRLVKRNSGHWTEERRSKPNVKKAERTSHPPGPAPERSVLRSADQGGPLRSLLDPAPELSALRSADQGGPLRSPPSPVLTDCTETPCRREAPWEQPDGEEKHHTCGRCGESWARLIDLLGHQTSNCQDRPHRCNICTKTFIKKQHLNSHRRTHTEDRPYTCHQCGRSFRQNSTLTTHLWSHAGHKPFHCSCCPKSFSRKTDLVAHMRRHTGERPYECPYCWDRFIRKKSLQRHLQKHTGENLSTDWEREYPRGKQGLVGRDLKTEELPADYPAEASREVLTSHLQKHTGENLSAGWERKYSRGKQSLVERDLKTEELPADHPAEAPREVRTSYLHKHTGENLRDWERKYIRGKQSLVERDLKTEELPADHPAEAPREVWTSHLQKHTGENLSADWERKYPRSKQGLVERDLKTEELPADHPAEAPREVWTSHLQKHMGENLRDLERKYFRGKQSLVERDLKTEELPADHPTETPREVRTSHLQTHTGESLRDWERKYIRGKQSLVERDLKTEELPADHQAEAPREHLRWVAERKADSPYGERPPPPELLQLTEPIKVEAEDEEHRLVGVTKTEQSTQTENKRPSRLHQELLRELKRFRRSTAQAQRERDLMRSAMDQMAQEMKELKEMVASSCSPSAQPATILVQNSCPVWSRPSDDRRSTESSRASPESSLQCGDGYPLEEQGRESVSWMYENAPPDEDDMLPTTTIKREDEEEEELSLSPEAGYYELPQYESCRIGERLPNISMLPLSADREWSLLARCAGKPGRFAALVFRALVPFDIYKSWVNRVNLDGLRGRQGMPLNVKRQVMAVVGRHFNLHKSDLSEIRNRLNEQLRTRRKSDKHPPAGQPELQLSR